MPMMQYVEIRRVGWFFLGLGVVAVSTCSMVFGAESAVDRSVALEARASIKRGLDFLKKTQKANGSWRDHPAITGLVAMAMLRSDREEFDVKSQTLQGALEFIRKQSKENGGIYDEFYASYSTSICVMALQEADLPQDEKMIEAARNYLLETQADETEDITRDDPQYGGWGYEKGAGGKKKHRPDMPNTQLALSALHMLEAAWREERKQSKQAGGGAEGEPPAGPCRQKTQLAYEKAIRYLRRCQNDDGGFSYRPNESKTGETRRGRLRSYGSTTYAGMKSLIYARVGKDAPRIRAANQWITNNWTLKYNPGMGKQGLYYYYQAMSECLDAYGKPKLVDAAGEDHLWRRELIKKLMALQQGNGSWVNESGHWMERVPELVTAYSVLALESALETGE